MGPHRARNAQPGYRQVQGGKRQVQGGKRQVQGGKRPPGLPHGAAVLGQSCACYAPVIHAWRWAAGAGA